MLYIIIALLIVIGILGFMLLKKQKIDKKLLDFYHTQLNEIHDEIKEAENQYHEVSKNVREASQEYNDFK